MERITRALLTHPVSRPALRDPVKYRLHAVKGIVVHWTANTARTATAINNRNYFNLGSRYASATYIVDDHSVVQCLPETEVAYHCGDLPLKHYKPAGLKMLEKKGETPNYYTIGFEMCVNAGSDWGKTYTTSVQLAACLLLKHHLGIHDLYRHFDITGKPCPMPLIGDSAWETFRTAVADEMTAILNQPVHIAQVKVDELNVRSEPNAMAEKLYFLNTGERVLVYETTANGWARIGEGEWLNARYLDALS